MTLAFPAAFSLKGHRALITGGGSGLGLAMAHCMVAAGAEVIIASRNEAKLIEACATLGPNASYIVHDVTDFDRTCDLPGVIAEMTGPISCLVNNSGGTAKYPVDEMSLRDFQNVMDTHVTGAFALVSAFVPQLKTQNSPSILFTASMSSFLGIPNVIGYSAAKSAYVGMVRALSTELAPKSIRVNGIAPGWVDTALSRTALSTDPERKAKVIGRIPMGRMGDTEDIGWAATFLTSQAARYVTGQILAVDGGALHGF